VEWKNEAARSPLGAARDHDEDLAGCPQGSEKAAAGAWLRLWLSVKGLPAAVSDSEFGGCVWRCDLGEVEIAMQYWRKGGDRQAHH
jgi:hypothetical protein